MLFLLEDFVGGWQAGGMYCFCLVFTEFLTLLFNGLYLHYHGFMEHVSSLFTPAAPEVKPSWGYCPGALSFKSLSLGQCCGSPSFRFVFCTLTLGIKLSLSESYFSSASCKFSASFSSFLRNHLCLPSSLFSSIDLQFHLGLHC